MNTNDRARRYFESEQRRRQFQVANPYPEEDTFSAVLAARQFPGDPPKIETMGDSDREGSHNRGNKSGNDNVQNILNDLAHGQKQMMQQSMQSQQ